MSGRRTASADTSPTIALGTGAGASSPTTVAFTRSGTAELPPLRGGRRMTPPQRSSPPASSTPSSPLPLVDFMMTKIRRSSTGDSAAREQQQQQRESPTTSSILGWRRWRRRRGRRARNDEEDEEAPSSPLLPNRFSIQGPTPSATSSEDDVFPREMRNLDEATEGFSREEEEEGSIGIISHRRERLSYPAGRGRELNDGQDRSSLRSGRGIGTLGRQLKSRILSGLSSSLVRMPGSNTSTLRRRRRRRQPEQEGEEEGNGSTMSGRSSSTPPLVVTMTDGIARIQTREEAARNRKKRSGAESERATKA